MDENEQHKALLEKSIPPRKLSFVSKLIKKGGETYTPSSCFIDRKEDIKEHTFKVIFGSRPLDIPFSKVENIWETDFDEIKIELNSTIVLDEEAKPGEQLIFTR